ncbi:MAG TPA: hypothetical protein VM841_04545 [Actinomycetota bacterium]|nr:hypothetical protein [Actinomycetota bacterium]
MDRSSNKHGPRIDDEIRKETDSITKGSPAETRVDAARRKEDPGDDQPNVEQVLNRTGHVPEHFDPRREATAHGSRPDVP